MGAMSLGVCFSTAQAAGEYFASSAFPRVEVGQVQSIQSVSETSPSQVYLSLSQYAIDGSVGGGYLVIVDFLPCQATIMQPKNLTEAFMFYQPTQTDISSLALILIGVPLMFYVIGLGFRKAYELLESHN
jgi:hypothetical protein